MITTEAATYHDEYTRLHEERLANAPAWLRDLHKRGWERFTELGIPTTREEEWRFTNIAPLASRPFTIAAPDGVATPGIEGLVEQATLNSDFHRLVYVNGHYSRQWSHIHELPAGVTVQSLAQSIRQRRDTVEGSLGRHAASRQSAFTSLNEAFVDDGAYVFVPDDVLVDRPIHLIFLSTGDTSAMSHPRNLVFIGKNSRATIVESYLGLPGSNSFTNAVTELEIADAAELDHCKLQHEQRKALHVATTQVRQQSNSRFRSHYFSFGSELARNELNCVLDGQEIECNLSGLYMPHDDQHMDCRTRIDHAQPHCNSFELFKGILDDQAKGVFNGKIYVHPDAQKTDAKQSNQALLLSDDAVIDTKPELEIYADDVRCTHGATVGELDEQALYYLRSRGIPTELARTMLIFAFANDVVQGVEVPAVRRHLESLLLADRGLPDVQ
ncbi:MAG: Fe-S cluster assembly protein SufD [Pirellulales bacterium]|nr:Fe-S cluster assembly protein SufD [Pirellulales bacterium]